MRLRPEVVRVGAGPIVVSIGAAAVGLGSYVFLTVAARSLGPVGFGELSTLWAVIFGLVAGMWYPFEQELTRMGADSSSELSATDVRRLVAVQGSTLATSWVFVVVIVGITGAFNHSAAMVGSLLLSLVSLAIAGLQRGVLLGSRRFGWAAIQQVADGLTRAVGSAFCAWLGADAGVFAVVLAAAPLVGVVSALPGSGRRFGSGAASRSWMSLSRDLGSLLAGSYVATVLLNVGPLVVRAGAGVAATGQFMAAFVIARVPLFFAGAVVAGLLPLMVEARRSSDRSRFGRVVRRLVTSVGALATLCCLVLGLLEPWIARTFFGASYDAQLSVSLLLTMSTAMFVCTYLLQGALVAAQRQGAVASAWLAGAAVFAVVLLLPLDLTLRIALAYLGASVAVTVSMALVLRAESRSPVEGVTAPTP